MADASAQIHQITDEMARQFRESGTWRLRADDIRRLLGLDHAAFYQRVYEAAHRRGGTVEVSTATQTFDPGAAGELVGLLELFAGSEAEIALARLGAFLPHEYRVELTRTLLETAHEWAGRHRVDAATFRQMVRTFGSYERARDIYFAEFFSQDELLQEAATRFAEAFPVGLPELGRRTAAAVLERLFRSHILEIQTVLASVGVRLFEIAVEEGFARRPEDEYFEWEAGFGGDRGAGAGGTGGAWSAGDRARADHSAGASGGPYADDAGADGPASRVAWACSILEIDPRSVTVAAVKRSYKKLMLRYHPDVNPRGLRIAQRVNRAYSVLLDNF